MDIHEQYMREALLEAEKAGSIGEIPVGAVIVKDDVIVGRGFNLTESMNDPTYHAEMVAIKNACRNLDAMRLTGCSMYVTLEPCSMCAGAIVLSRIDKLYIGASDPKSGACLSLNNITTDERLNHQVELYSGLLQEECSDILKKFFKALRRRSKTVSEE